MYELVQVGERTYYIDCPAKIGVFRADNGDVFLIDSGSDKDAGRKVRQILYANGWTLKAILNTHAHADHIGGNRYLQGQTGCKICAQGIETGFVRHPLLEPSFLYGGYPCKELRHKFLMAQESNVAEIGGAGFPAGFGIIPLPGHSFDMVGFRTPDNVVFLADAVSSRETLDKYGIPFICDVDAYFKTLDTIESMEAAIFIPSHTEAVKDIKALVCCNRSRVLEIADRLLAFCETPATFERILQEMFRQYRLEMCFEQYVLVGSTIRSYLSWLRDSGRLTVSFEDALMYWTRAAT